MNVSNKKSGLFFAIQLAFAAVFVVIFFGLTITQANAATDGWHIKDDATGGECSVIGSWDAVSKTCALSQDLSQGIIIDSDNVTFDGTSHTITGDIPTSGYLGSSSGIYIASKNFVTVKNAVIQKFVYGVWTEYSNNVVIFNIRPTA